MGSVSTSREGVIRAAALSGLSGLVSGGVVAVGLRSSADLWGQMVLYLPGGLFALLALFPLLRGLRFQMPRGLGLLAVSVATHDAAVRLSIAGVDKGSFLLLISAVGAVAAAVVSVSSALLLGIRTRAPAYAAAVASGAVSGLLIGAPFSSGASFSDAAETVLIVSGYLVWQCGVATALVSQRGESAA